MSGPVPQRMQNLARDEAGRAAPWYAAWSGGKPDYRVARAEAMAEALRFRLCWLCGQPTGSILAFLSGPETAVTRRAAEGPAHATCAEYAVRLYPIYRGVAVIWVTRRFDVWYPHKDAAPLLMLGDPIDVFWFRSGRRAYRLEVLNAIGLGLPELRRAAMEDGPRALAQLDAQIRAAKILIPSDDAPMDTKGVVTQ